MIRNDQGTLIPVDTSELRKAAEGAVGSSAVRRNVVAILHAYERGVLLTFDETLQSIIGEMRAWLTSDGDSAHFNPSGDAE